MDCNMTDSVVAQSCFREGFFSTDTKTCTRLMATD